VEIKVQAEDKDGQTWQAEGRLLNYFKVGLAITAVVIAGFQFLLPG